jgi:hypothetical protein
MTAAAIIVGSELDGLHIRFGVRAVFKVAGGNGDARKMSSEKDCRHMGENF